MVGTDCSDGNDCTDDVCTDGVCSNPDLDADVACTQDGGSVCDGAGTCVECNSDNQCGVEETCVDNTCVGSTTPCGTQSQVVTVGCTNSVTTAQSPFPFVLEVNNVPAITGGGSFTADFDGIGIFPEFFLDAAQGVVPGGVAVAELVDIVSTVQVRSGATGADVPLGPDTASLNPGAVRFCGYPPSQACTCPAGTAPDATCAGGPSGCLSPICGVEKILADLPNSTDCAPGGACDMIGKTGAGSQCALNGFCITGDLIIEFEEASGTFTADASGEVLFGWADGVGPGTTPVPDLVLCPAAAPSCTAAFMPDGCYDLPAAVFSNPTAPIGIRVNASGLFVPIQCAQAEAGGICASGEGCLVDGDCATGPCTGTTDVVCPTPDASLISCPIN